MKIDEINGNLVWKEMEDILVPRPGMNVIERAVYSHLLRHSRLEGKLRLRFSIYRVARGAGLSAAPVRGAVRRLVAKGVLRLVERSRAGHVVEVRLPSEVRSVRAHRMDAGAARQQQQASKLEEQDFLQTRAGRQAIYARDGGFCFYCLRRLNARIRCLDHVVPQVRMGGNTYRNLVSACAECNSQKGEMPAEDFLRSLYRERRLTAVELAERVRALEALAAGKLRPAWPASPAQSSPRPL